MVIHVAVVLIILYKRKNTLATIGISKKKLFKSCLAGLISAAIIVFVLNNFYFIIEMLQAGSAFEIILSMVFWFVLYPLVKKLYLGGIFNPGYMCM